MPESGSELNENQPPVKKEIIKTGHAVAAGAAAAASPEAIKLLKKHDKLSTPIDQRNILETGHHAVTAEELNNVISKFYNGDPDTNIWNLNPELETRLASFAPSVLTIDGLESTPTGQEINKNRIWLLSPGRPRKINQLGFYAISGDLGSYPHIAHEIAFWSQEPYNSEVDKNMKLLDEYELRNPSVYGEYINKQNTLAVTASIGSVILASVLMFSDSSSRETSPSVNRRTFLKGVAAGAATLATTSLLKATKTKLQEHGPHKASYSIDQQQKEFWQTLTSYVDDMPPWVWLDGRTAMLIAKHEDAIDFLRENKYLSETAKSAIVMGSHHAYKAGLYMHDKTARDAAILSYAKHTTDIANEFIYDHYNFPAENRSKLSNNILNYFSKLEINHISDPGIPPGTILTDYIETNIRPVHTFTSTQVENAIKPLRSK